MNELHTPRLRLREVDAGDFDFLARLMNEGGYLTHVGDRAVRTAADAAQYVSSASLYDYSAGLGFNLVELRQDGAPIGVCGLVARAEQGVVEIGYGLLDGAAGCGFAFEAAVCVARHAFGPIGLAALRGVVNEDNAASRRILTKLGMTLTRIEPPGKCVYQVEAREFAQRFNGGDQPPGNGSCT